MEFTINSKQKKVELFYESEKEQAAIMEFISKWLTFKEEQSNYIPKYQENEIAWASNSTARGIYSSLTGHTYADTTGTFGTIDNIVKPNDVPNAIVLNTTDLGSLTASDDLPSGCIHVSAKSK